MTRQPVPATPHPTFTRRAEKALETWHENKARLRYFCNQSLDAGAVQLGCPQCKGWVVTNLETHNKKVQVSKNAISLRIRHPGDDDPNVTYDGEHHSSKCCEGLVSVPVEKLDLWQEPAWGTPDWRKSYGRRLMVETGNSKLKADGGLDNRFCRAKGLGAHTLAALAVTIMHNLNEAMKDPVAGQPDEDGAADTEVDDDGDDGDWPVSGAGDRVPVNPNNRNGDGNGLRAPP